MLFGVFVIVDANKQDIARILHNRCRVISILNLLQSGLRVLVPLQLDDQRRIIGPVFRFRQECKIRKSAAGWQFPNRLKIILRR